MTKAKPADNKAPKNQEKMMGKFIPPKKPEVAAFIDSISLMDGPEINLSRGIDKIIIKKIK